MATLWRLESSEIGSAQPNIYYTDIYFINLYIEQFYEHTFYYLIFQVRKKRLNQTMSATPR